MLSRLGEKKLWKRTVSGIMVTLLFLNFFPMLGTSLVKSAAPRIIKITDYATGLNSTTLGNATRQLPSGGIPFTVRVSLSGLTSNLGAWQVGIVYDNSILNCTNAWIPSSDPSYVFHGKSEILSPVDNSPPQVTLGSALLDQGNPATVDEALLCLINFTAFKVGEKSETVISFYTDPYTHAPYTFLSDNSFNLIPFEEQTFSVNVLEGTIVPDNYPTIQSAINGVNSGDSILVRRGTYNENVVANKTVALFGEDRNDTVIDGGGLGYGVGIRGVDNVTISNFTVQNCQTGIYAGDYGSGIASSRGNIFHNIVRNCSETGIFASQTRYTISDNLITDNGVGISILGSGGVRGTYQNNTIEKSTRYNLELNASMYDQFDFDTTNLADGKPVYCWTGRSGETVPLNAGQVTLISCFNITVRDLELVKNWANVQLISSTSCTVMNTDSSFADIGILLVNSRECNINNDTLANCRIGLQVLESANNSIIRNNLLMNDFCAIDFGNSENNSFHHNTVNSTGATYVVYRAGFNTWDNGFEGNYWSDYNGTDVDQDGIGDTPYIIDANNTDHYPLVAKQNLMPIHNLDTGLDYAAIQAAIDAPETLNGHRISVEAGTYNENLVVDKSVSLVGENRATTVIDGSFTGAVVNITANTVSLTGFTIRNSGTGYQNCGVLVSSSGNLISGNDIENNSGDGICLLLSSNGNNITGNSVQNNTRTGIYCSSSNNNLDGNNVEGNGYNGVSLHSSDNNIISDNNITDNHDGIYIWSSSCNNTISGNNVTVNNYHGVWLDSSSNNSLLRNSVTDNGEGITLQTGSSFNSLIGNDVADNHDFGVGVEKSSYNNIYHNSFDNDANVVGTLDLVNLWDNGYPSGGNYWSDFSGNDSFRGVYQNETGRDGIVDSPHILDENNTDHYPLTKPCAGQHDIGIVTVYTSEHATGHLHLWISAEVVNYGEQAEAFDVSVKANSTAIQTQTITLASRNSTTVTFMWNTTGVAVGNYSIALLASMVQGETDITDNTLTLAELVFVTAPGDITGVEGHSDGVVDMQDIMVILGKFNTRLGSPLWDPVLDVNDDGVTNMRDGFLAILNYSVS
jgi:parallel beta-helix repeat protein